MKKIFSRSRFSTTFFPGLPAIFRVVCVTVLLIGIAGCPDEKPVEPPPANPLQIKVEDVTCTETFLTLSLAGSEKNRSVILKRGDSTIAAITMASNDSLFVDEGLLPNKTYTYKLTYGDWSATAQAATMDTTSHDWTWEITALGDGNGSALYDVAIINDTLAYAVGEIHTGETDKFDSLGNWVAPYNVAKWDGKKWNLIQLKWNCRLYYPNCGPETMLFSPATSVFAFGPNDVWISSGSVHHFDGTKWTEEAGILGAGSANKIWGNPVVGLYFVGNNGFIAHRSANGTWQKIESGTTQYLQDVNGAIDHKTGKRTILCAASHPLGYGEEKIFSINDNGIVDTVAWQPQRVVMSVWLSNPSTYYTCGEGVFRKGVAQRWKEIAGADVIRTFTERIRGQSSNDIFVVGDFGIIAHFNGVDFRIYPEATTARVYKSVDLKGNQMIAVGYTSSRAVILLGKRN